MGLKYKVIAVDFDGTLTYGDMSEYPFIPENDINFSALEALEAYKKAGGRVILWTCRTDDDLLYAIECMEKHGIVFDEINRDLPDVIDAWKFKQPRSSMSPKVFCDMYIDDKAYPNTIRGIDWVLLRRELLREE